MEAERIDNIIKIFEAFQKGNDKKEEPSIAFSETLKKRTKKVEGEELLKVSNVESKQVGGLKEDTLTISDEAKKAYELVKIVKIIRETPDVRVDKMEEAKREIESGALFRQKVTEAIVEKLIH